MLCILSVIQTETASSMKAVVLDGISGAIFVFLESIKTSLCFDSLSLLLHYIIQNIKCKAILKKIY